MNKSFSEFIRTGTPQEKEEVFTRVIDKAIKDQKKVLQRLKDHDERKIKISTDKIEKLLPDVKIK